LETAWDDTVAKEKAMEQYVDISLRFWADFSAWHPPLVVWYTMLGFGAMSAWTISRFISAPPLVAGPVSFLILTYAAMIANFASRSHIMMGTTEFEKTLCYTVLAHHPRHIPRLSKDDREIATTSEVLTFRPPSAL
jgi:hypothetical protein